MTKKPGDNFCSLVFFEAGWPESCIGAQFEKPNLFEMRLTNRKGVDVFGGFFIDNMLSLRTQH